MALESAITHVLERLQALHEALAALHTTIAEDRPVHGDSALVEILSDSAENLVGWTAEAQQIARDGWHALLRGDGDTTRRALAACHEQIIRVDRALRSDLLGYERLADLGRFGRTQGGEWRAWARIVHHALKSCQPPLFDVEDALLACWQEFAASNIHLIRGA